MVRGESYGFGPGHELAERISRGDTVALEPECCAVLANAHPLVSELSADYNLVHVRQWSCSILIFEVWHANDVWPWHFDAKRGGHHLGPGCGGRVPLQMETEHEHE